MDDRPKDLSDLYEEMEQRLRKYYYGWEGSNCFDGTADRLTRAFGEMFWTNEQVEAEIERSFKAQEVDSYNELLVEGPIEVWTLCPHHLLPCRFTVYIGYIPNELVLGLSKFSRIAEALSKRPVIQEMYSRELVTILNDRLNPRGVGVFIVGEHGCMRARGVHQNANVTTSVLRGELEYRAEKRSEFFAIVRGGNGK